jgi:hypothetical protein
LKSSFINISAIEERKIVLEFLALFDFSNYNLLPFIIEASSNYTFGKSGD